MKKNILIFYGGESVEHDISIITAIQVMENIDLKKYNFYPIYITQEGQWTLPKNAKEIDTYKDYNRSQKIIIEIDLYNQKLYEKRKNKLKEICKIDCAFLCGHGTKMEDGCLQGFLELAKIPYTSTNVFSSALCMEKILMKDVFVANNLPCVNYMYLNKSEYKTQKNIEKIIKKLQFPMIIKPSNLGSSIGINKCTNEQELISAIEIAFQYDNRIIIESMITSLREFNLALFENENKMEFSIIEEPKNWQEFLTFEDKYIKRKKTNNLKVKLEQKYKNQIYKLGEKAYKIFGCKGVVRIDFMMDNLTKKIYINELNTIPGSMSFYLWKGKYNFEDFITKQIELAILSRKEKSNLIHNYSSVALQNFGSKSIKK